MPFDLWFRSTSVPVAFEPERLPIPPLATRSQAESVVGSVEYFAGPEALFELVAVEAPTELSPKINAMVPSFASEADNVADLTLDRGAGQSSPQGPLGGLMIDGPFQDQRVLFEYLLRESQVDVDDAGVERLCRTFDGLGLSWHGGE